MNRNAEKIAELVTIPMLLSYYGYPVARKKRIPCPLHSGKDANFCYTDKVFHCWSCGEKGNVISLEMKMFGLSFPQAVMKLNTDFRLGISGRKPTIRERSDMAMNQKLKSVQTELLERKKHYYKALCLYHRYLFEMVLKMPQDLILKAIQVDLERWLDENIEEVVQPWQLNIQSRIF